MSWISFETETLEKKHGKLFRFPTMEDQRDCGTTYSHLLLVDAVLSILGDLKASEATPSAFLTLSSPYELRLLPNLACLRNRKSPTPSVLFSTPFVTNQLNVSWPTTRWPKMNLQAVANRFVSCSAHSLKSPRKFHNK